MKKTESKAAFDAQRGTIFLLDPEDVVIVTDPSDPLYDERVNLPLDEKMVLNMMHCGVVKVVEITKRGDEAVVVDGRQRIKHAREANKRLRERGMEPLKVRCSVRRGSDAELFGVGCTANEFNRGDSVVLKAEKMNRLMTKHGRSIAECAILFGVTEQTIRNWQAVLELSAPVRKAVDEGRIAVTAAAKLHNLPVADQKEKLNELLLTEGKPTVRKTERALRADTPGGDDRPRMRTMKECQEELDRVVGDDAASDGYRRGLKYAMGINA